MEHYETIVITNVREHTQFVK